VSAVRREAAAAGVDAEVVVVEQSEDAGERQRVAALRPDQLLERPNRGYAAGINAGIATARAETLLVANPDLELLPGSLAALLAALAAGWEVVAPLCRIGSFVFPPADDPRPVVELRRWLAGWSRRYFQRLLVREIMGWERVWQSSDPVAVPALSGAALAFRAVAARRVGPWDEEYFLYFEENDWLRRARRLGMALAVVPAAAAEHRWGHAIEPAEHGPRFASSRRRFLRRHHPLLGRLVARLHPRPLPVPVAPLEGLPPATPGERLLWLLSPAPLGIPAARFVGTEPVVEAVEELARALLRPRDLTLLACDPSTRRLRGAWRFAAQAR
jgi:GT2 family glycosyltransferase